MRLTMQTVNSYGHMLATTRESEPSLGDSNNHLINTSTKPYQRSNLSLGLDRDVLSTVMAS